MCYSADKTMDKKAFVNALATESGQTKTAVTAVLDALRPVIVKAMKDGEDVSLFRGFRCVPYDMDERERRNPSTGETFVVPAHRVMKVKVGTAIKKEVAE